MLDGRFVLLLLGALRPLLHTCLISIEFCLRSNAIFATRSLLAERDRLIGTSLMIAQSLVDSRILPFLMELGVSSFLEQRSQRLFVSLSIC